MNNTIKRPATVRELGNMAEEMNMTAAQLLEFLGPWPEPPAGYTLDPHSDVRWLGPETCHRKWIITPVWNSATEAHSLDVWLADHQPPNYAEMSSQDALELAAVLSAAAATNNPAKGTK
ncbi:hypothetical protein [Arthrobacter sp. D5-1]|uniref:hypothetical protein n=1 Tax=Arthrobacter sp. D5-1 TaxID=1477518 RepID=UPI001A98A8BE|nr:hypothetical protein [Arthrobacter sp. D5-1]QSZ47210.1 hypothetical protein AYX22_01465 [Arthrobacter sp. D5-1]